MSKRSSKKSKPANSPGKASGMSLSRLETLSQRAEQDLLSGNFRRAREGFRRLMREDAERFGGPFWIATEQAFNAALAGGQLSEAKELLNGAAKFEAKAFANRYNMMRLRLMASSTAPENMLEQVWSAMGDSWKLGELGSAEKIFLADCMVLSAEVDVDIPVEIKQEGEAVKMAIRAVVGGNSEAAEDLLRPLSSRSIFSNWKLFLKGFIAMRDSDFARASRFFQSTEMDCAPGRASRLCDKIIQEQRGFSETELRALAFLAGEPQAADVLPTVQSQWKKGQLLQALETLLKDAKPFFPALDTSVWRDLTDFFFQRSHDEDRALNRWMDVMLRKIPSPAFDPIQAFVLARFFVNAWYGQTDTRKVRDARDAMIRGVRKLHGMDPITEARINFHIAKIVLKGDPDAEVEARFAESMLIEATELDPHFLEAQFFYGRLLRQNGDKARLNEFYKNLTRLFPENPRVLRDAGFNDLKREVYKRGADRLEKALAMDPLDRTIPKWLIYASELKARKHYENSEVDLARACFDRMSPYLTDDINDPVRGRVYIKDLQIELEESVEIKIDRLIEKEVASQLSKSTRLLVRLIRSNIFGRKTYRGQVYREALEKKFYKTKPKSLSTLTVGFQLKSQLYDFAEPPDMARVTSILFSYSVQLVDARVKSTAEEVRQFAKVIDVDQPDPFANRLIMVASEHHKNDPFIQMLHIVYSKKLDDISGFHFFPPPRRERENDLNLFRYWRNKAKESGDLEALEMSDPWERYLRADPKKGDEWDDEDDDWEDEDDFPTGPPDQVIVNQLKTLSEAEIEALAKFLGASSSEIEAIKMQLANEQVDQNPKKTFQPPPTPRGHPKPDPEPKLFPKPKAKPKAEAKANAQKSPPSNSPDGYEQPDLF